MVVFAEATSSIDVETDAAIQQTIRTAFKDSTVMTIAHRISTVIDYDMIIVMEAGRVAEVGGPGDLLARPDGIFRRLAIENGAFNAEAEFVGGSDVIEGEAASVAPGPG